jgi:ATP-binding cassette subfamily B protein
MLLRMLRTFSAPYRHWIAFVVVLQFIATVAQLYLPSLNADIIDNGVAKGDTNYIWKTGGVMLAVSLAQIVAQGIAVWFASRTAMSIGRDVRKSIFHQVSTFSHREVNHFGPPSLITRTTNDVQQVQMLAQLSMTMMVTAPIMMVGGVFMAMREDIGLSWLVAVSVPVLVGVMSLIVWQMVPGFRQMQKRLDEVNRILREQITGIRVVRAFVREESEARRFEKANRDLTDVAIFTGRWMATAFPTLMLVLNLSMAAVIWFGGHRVAAGDMQIGAMTAFLTYMMQILMSVMMATFMVIMVPRAAVSADRISEVLDTESSVTPAATPVTDLTSISGVEFDSVEFRYPGASDPVIRDVSFSAPVGQTTAIIGSTGAGKSTLVSLVPRLFDVTGGSVRLGGVDVRDLEEEELWSHIGLIPQKAFLFSGTIASNLRYGKPEATEEEMWRALEVAQAADFVRAMPEGLEAPVAQGGGSLSGGQRQRMAIARALIKQPSVYVFDDSFSALDVATDARLRAALRPHTKSSAILVVAQRVSTILDADQIVVMEDGAIVGQGRHKELLTTCPTYREIVESQLTVEDVA